MPGWTDGSAPRGGSLDRQGAKDAKNESCSQTEDRERLRGDGTGFPSQVDKDIQCSSWRPWRLGGEMGSACEIRLILSDFGGVICTFDYRIFCKRLAQRTGRTADQIYTAVFNGSLQGDFESGKLSGRAYHRAVMARLGADVTYEEFFPMYGDIFTEIPATCELLRRLHGRYPLYLLSDTNEIHFGYVRETVEVLSLFDQFVVSYEVGAMKPDPRIYQEALRRSGLPASACVFVDDREANVLGALRVGIPALRFESADRLADDLTSLGVVIP